MLFLVTAETTGRTNDLCEELGFSGIGSTSVEVTRRLGSIHSIRSVAQVEEWEKKHSATLSALPWRVSILSNGQEWRTETKLDIDTFLDLHRANYQPARTYPARNRQ